MSGYPTEALMQRGDRFAQDTPLLIKPFPKTILAKALREAPGDGAEVPGTEGERPPSPPIWLTGNRASQPLTNSQD